jgi:hypothetical protein
MEEPVAGRVDHLERRKVEAGGAAGGAGGGEHGVGESLVEDQVTLDVRVAAAGEIRRRDFRGGEGHRGAKAGAQGALGVGGDEGEAAGVGLVAALEAAGVDAGGGKGGAVGGGEVVGPEFAKEGGAEAEAGGVEGGVGRGAAGGLGGRRGEQADDALHLGGVDQDHAAFLTCDVLAEELVRHGGEQIHDGEPTPMRSKEDMKRKEGGRKAESVGDGQAGGKEGFVVDLDEEGVLARLRESEVADFVDEIDAVQRALRLEGALEQRFEGGGIEPHRDAEAVFARRAVRKGEKPDHERMRDRELARLDVGEDAEDGVFAGAGIDVHAVAGQPREELRFGMHGDRRAAGPGWRK